ncbi:ATP-binding cassette domain-containing protein [Flagellimonas sp.]|uniref:ATP-binding cassette domain-containing protein n=1 Tax=Flagellimonas sp. TaxID=2058762 RepID=UPI003B5BB793
MVLEIDNIELNFGTKRVLSGIYLQAEKGEVTGILGRNGSGKTSLFNILFGSLQPKYKTIRINGKNVNGKLFLSNRIAYLPQHSLLPKGIKVVRAFKLFNADWHAFLSTFETFKVYNNDRISELSSGEIRVIETYLILNLRKDIILLDEPFSFIAPVYIERFKKLIQDKKTESIILMTDHFYRDIMQISNRVYLFKDGSSKLITTKEDLVDNGYILSNSRQK